MDYEYKQLSANDLPQFKELLKVFGEAFNDINTYQKAIPSDDYLRVLLNKPEFIVLVAVTGDKIVGGLAAYVLEKFEQERSEIYIYDLAVALEHRRKGLATNLINELKRIGKTKNAYVIFVQADPGDDPAIKLYESLGVREDVHHFDILIND